MWKTSVQLVVDSPASARMLLLLLLPLTVTLIGATPSDNRIHDDFPPSPPEPSLPLYAANWNTSPHSLHRQARSLSLWTSTSLSVLLIVGTQCTLAASHAPPGESRWVCRRDRQTDGRTPDRYITFSAERGQHNDSPFVYCIWCITWVDRPRRVPDSCQ